MFWICKMIIKTPDPNLDLSKLKYIEHPSLPAFPKRGNKHREHVYLSLAISDRDEYDNYPTPNTDFITCNHLIKGGMCWDDVVVISKEQYLAHYNRIQIERMARQSS